MPRPGTPALALLALALPALAADTLQVKTGLWETTTTTNNAGFSIPAERLAKMPPAQRAKAEQLMKQLGARGPQTTREKSCVTAKDLELGAFRGRDDDDKACKYTQVSATPRRQEFTVQCSNEDQTTTGRMVVEAPDSTHVTGSIETKTDSTTVSIRFTGQWLSASCAGADED